jgi:hypothetical protein
MWEQFKAKHPGTFNDCCEKHAQHDRDLFYFGAIALHEYITGEEFAAVETESLCETLDKDVAKFEQNHKAFAMARMKLGSEKLQ